MSEALASFLNIIFTILWLAILGRAIVSWFPIGRDNPIVVILYQLTEPILAPIRRIMPRMGMFDFSPIIALILIWIAQSIVNVALRS